MTNAKPSLLKNKPLDQGIKYDDDKPRYDLIPPIALDQAVKVITFGSKKYGPNNWKMIERLRYLGAALRHIFAFMRNEKKDDESGLPHLAHAIASLLFLLEHENEEFDLQHQQKIVELKHENHS